MTTTILKKHIVALALAVLGVCGGTFLILTMGRLVKSRMAKVITADEQLASYQANKKVFAEEAASIASIKQTVATLGSYQITSDTIPQLLSSMEALAQKDAVQFSITAVQTPGKSGNQKLFVDFSATGSEKSLDTFLADMTHQTYQIAFTKLSLFANTDNSFGSVPPPSTTVTSTSTGAATTTATPPVGGWDILASIQVVSY